MSELFNRGYGLMPNAILYNEDLGPSAKLFFICVSSHIAERGYAFATNKYFAAKMRVTERQIQRWLVELQAYLFTYEENGQRRIMFYPGDKEAWGVTKKTGGG